jgi:hypothetical protein
VTLEQAFLRVELVEHLARIATLAEAVGGVKALPASALPALLAARTKAGLGPEARGASAAPPPPATSATLRAPRVVACAPSPDANVEIIAPGKASTADLASIIREELGRALRK